jgi:hypothetical protein
MYVFECYPFDFDEKKKKAQINKCPNETLILLGHFYWFLSMEPFTLQRQPFWLTICLTVLS